MWMPLAMTLLAGLSTGLGGLIPLFLPASDRLMAASMGFAGGVMLTVSLADLLPGALGWYRQALPPLPAALALVSLLCMGMGLAALMGRLLPPASAPAVTASRKMSYASSKRTAPFGSSSAPIGPHDCAVSAPVSAAAFFAQAMPAAMTSRGERPLPSSLRRFAPKVLA